MTVAGMLAVAAMALVTRAQRSPSDGDMAAGFRSTRAVAGAIPVLLALFFLTGNQVNWQVLAIGLSWRAFLFVCVAPYL